MPAKSKSSSSSHSDTTSKPNGKKPLVKRGPEGVPGDGPAKPTLSELRSNTLDLLEDKPKRRRDLAVVAETEAVEQAPAETPASPQATASDAEPTAVGASTPEAPAAPVVPEKLSALDELKKDALSLFDKEGKKAEQRRRREELAAAAAAASKALLPPISRTLQDKEIKREQEAADLATLFQKKMEELAPSVASAAHTALETTATTHVVTASETSDDPKLIHIKPPIVVKDLAERMGIKPFKLVADLMDIDIWVNQNQTIEPEVAARLCEKHGFTFERERREKGAGIHKDETPIEAPKPTIVHKVEEMSTRPPIVTIMGHVDHGKTSLLDAIRKAKVAAGEAGGITQHIGAYTVVHEGQTITFLDTPGHAAFTAMRARGANLTDIVILVVAADDGLMPQTLESISHAKAAGVTIVVAMNKMDLPTVNVDRLYAQLQEQGLSPEAWGGTTAVMPVSALKGTGVKELLEHTLLEAELLELKENSNAPCRAIVVESRVEPGRGPTATVIPRTGTLKVGASFICGPLHGKVKSMSSDSGQPVKSAGPAIPVEVVGFSDLPNVGDELVVMGDKDAKKLGEQRAESQRKEKLMAPRRTSLESIFKTMAEGGRKELRIVLKSDVQGSLEAIVGQLKEIKSAKIDLTILHAAVGPITESDVLLGSASDAIIIGFATKVEGKAVKAARAQNVEIKLYSIIYELFDQVKEAMLGKLDPTTREKVIGHAVVKQIFKVQKGKVAGCGVTDGKLIRSGHARVIRGREKIPVYDGRFHTLRRYTDEVTEVRNGLECGVRLGDFDDYEDGDVIECYELEKLAQTL